MRLKYSGSSRSRVFIITCVCFTFLILPFLIFAAAHNFTEHQIGGSTYDQVRAMEAIDLDEDGDVDIVSVADVLDDLTWWDNNGSESFTQRTIDGSIDSIYDIKVIDVDQDNDLDIVAGAPNSSLVTLWYENNGSETFTKRTVQTGNSATCVDAGDVDGDLDIDIVGCDYGEKIVWYENDGSEVFTERTVSTGNTTPIQVRAVDLDDDGDMDIVSTWQTGNKILWYDNNGSETFTQRTIDSSATTPWYMVVGDVDDDGDKDVVAAVNSDNAVVFYENDGSESFTEQTVATLSDAEGVAIGDVDGDGDKDIAATGYDASTVAWYDNDGNETFTLRTVNSSFEQAGRIQVINIDGDSDQDLVTAGLTNNNDNVTWWENTGPTAPSVSTLSPADGGYNISTTANLVITFDQTVQGGTGAVTIKKSSDNSVVETLMMTGGLISGSGSTQITINPSVTLITDTDYYINIGKNVFKGANSPHYAGIANATTWNFTTTDTIAPTISTFSPADNATGINQTANLVITFGEIVQGGTGTIIIKQASDGSTIESIAANNTTYVSGSGTTQITINPASTLTAYVDYYITIHQNAFKDRAGNKFAGVSSSSTWNFTTADLTNPTLSSVTPTDNSTGVSNTVNLVMNFSEVVQGGTGTIVVKKGSDNSVVETVTANNTTYVSGSGTTQITLNLSGALALNTSYYVLINKNSFQDAFGRDYAGFTTTTTWNFTTSSSDTTKPLLVSLSPADGATGVAGTANLTLIFDEIVQGGTGTVVVKKSSDNSAVETITANNTNLVSGSGTTLITINPATTLSDNTSYYVIVNKNAFQDSRGNDYKGFTGVTTWDFATADTTAPVLSGTGSTATSTGVTIVWTTNEAASSRVQFGPTLSYGSYTTLADTSPRVTSHSVAIASLKTCARYHYRVISTDSSSNTATGSNLSFTTTGCTGSASVQAQTGVLITRSVTTTLRLGSTGAMIRVPSGATAYDTVFQIKELNKNSVTTSAGTPTGYALIGSVFNLLALSGATTAVTSFSDAITVSLEYTDADVDGKEESSLWIYRYDGSSWSALSGCTVDISAKTVTCTTTAFSDFSIVGTEASVSSSDTSSTSVQTLSGGGGRRHSVGVMAQRIAKALNDIAFRFAGLWKKNDPHRDASVFHASGEERQLQRALKKAMGIIDLNRSEREIAAEKRGLLYATVGHDAVIYRDVPVDAWFAPYVASLVQDGIASGYRDADNRPTGEFGVSTSVTYAEVLKMAFESIHTPLKGLLPPRNTAAKGTWAAPYVAAAESRQLRMISSSLNVHTAAARGEVVHLILDILALPIAHQKPPFSDIPSSHPHAEAIATAAFYGLIEGDTDSDGSPLDTFRPDDTMNRAEVAKIIATLRELVK